jgi:hypothetical protein
MLMRGAMGEISSRRRAPSAFLPLALVVVVLGLIVLGLLALQRQPDLAGSSPLPSIVVGVPGGAVIPEPTPVPTPSLEAAETEAPPEPTSEPTAAPTPPATPEPTIAPTPVPVAETTSPPVQTPEPTPAVVAVAGPADTVAAFYANVVDGAFDAAYALWSDRMRATYPREANLDNRFDDTAGITFHQLAVVGQGPGSATVQANFTETAESGSSMEFIGYWELVQVDGRWLLDEPHY